MNARTCLTIWKKPGGQQYNVWKENRIARWKTALRQEKGKGNFMNANFEFLSNLQLQLRGLKARLQAFESGDRYVKIQEGHHSQLAVKNQEIKRLKRELAEAHSRTIDVRNKWMQANEDLLEEQANELSKKDQKITALEKQLLNTQIMLDAQKDKYRDITKELYQVKIELEDEKGKNQQLKAQINRDYENSSKPSSQKPNHKTIVNNREKTGRKRGGQPGHKGHLRKKHTPTNSIPIPAPEEYASSPDYKLTGKTISKQVVSLKIGIIVDEYFTPEFRHVRTGQRVHADFPEGAVNDVNYSGDIKSFLYLLNNYCNVSIGKSSEFLAELTGGELKISTGMINGLSKEFSLKTEADQKKAFADILLSPVLNTDFTSARVNGHHVTVGVCTTPSVVTYFAREHKGHEGIKDTPVEGYQHTLVHDHDITYYSYAYGHQECLEHVLRYLKDSIGNEAHLKWNMQMRELIREMIHFRKHLNTEDNRNPDEIDPGKVEKFETRYDEILSLAKEEYEYEPPTKYYKDGFNLHKKLLKYRDNHLLFLHDRRVPYTNNLAERHLRLVKRKQHQVMTFRSFASLGYLCNTMGIVASLRAQDKNLYTSVASIFDKQIDRGVYIAS
jgi:hypothetical protein